LKGEKKMKKILSLSLMILMTFSVLAEFSPQARAQSTPEQLTTNPWRDSHPSWHPDGTKIAYNAFSDSWYRNVWVMNSDGSGKDPLTSGNVINEAPAFSPDGAKIAFTHWGYRGDYHDLMIMNVDGTGIERITYGGIPGLTEGTYEVPQWSKDGSTLIFGYGEGTTGMTKPWWICSVKIDRSELKVINNVRGLNPRFCYDDTKIIFNTDPFLGDMRIAIMNADGTAVDYLTDGPTDWGPDMAAISHRIVFTRGNPGDLYVMNTDGSNEVQLTSDGESHESSWSPDEKYIAYTRGIGQNYDIWKMKVPRIFDPSVDGFSFPNLFKETKTEEYPDGGPFDPFYVTENEIRTTIINNPEFSLLNNKQKEILVQILNYLIGNVNDAMYDLGIGGYCYGMSAAAKHYFLDPDEPEPNVVYEMPFESVYPTIRDLQLSSYVNPYMLGKIFQLYLSPLIPTPFATNNLAELSKIKEAIENEGVVIVLLQNNFIDTPYIFWDHAVLAYHVEESPTGDMVWIYDPNKRGETRFIEVEPNGDFSYNVGGIEFHQFGAIVSEETVFDYLMTFLRRIYALVVHSPANAFVRDPLGRSTGTDPETGLVVNEIPDALYSGPDTEPQLVLIFDPIDGTYNIVLTGKASGNYTLAIEYITETQTTEQALSGSIVFGQTQEFAVEVSEESASLYVCATVDVKPDALNLKSRSNWITCYIELPEGYSLSDVDVSTVMLNDTIPISLLDVPAPEPVPTEIGDYDSGGIPDLMVKFDRTMVSELILSKDIIGGNVTLTVTGEVDGTPFEGSDSIKVLFPPPWHKSYKR